METKEYFEKVMQDFNQNRRGRNLRKYCSDEGIDYKWLSEYKKQYSSSKGKVEKEEVPSLIPLQVIDERFSKGKKFGRAYEWLVEYAAHNRNEFSHWVKGFVPYPRLG